MYNLYNIIIACDFTLSSLNIYINTDVSGIFFQDSSVHVNQYVSYNINIQSYISTLNKLFLFYSDNDTTDNIYVLVNWFSNEDIYISEYNNTNPTISHFSPTVTTEDEILNTGNSRLYINLN